MQEFQGGSRFSKMTTLRLTAFAWRLNALAFMYINLIAFINPSLHAKQVKPLLPMLLLVLPTQDLGCSGITLPTSRCCKHKSCGTDLHTPYPKHPYFALSEFTQRWMLLLTSSSISPSWTCPGSPSPHYLCLQLQQHCYSLLQPCCSFLFLYLFIFILIARCSPVKTIPGEALEHGGLNNKEKHGKPCAMKSGSAAKLKQSEAELEMSELFTASNLSSCLLADKELGCFLRLIQEMGTKRYVGIPCYTLKG